MSAPVHTRPGYLDDPEFNARLALAANAALHGQVLCDLAGRIEWVNEGFTGLFGHDLAAARNLSICELLACPESDPEVLRLIAERLAEQEGARAELLCRARSGRRVWIDFDIRPVLGPDRVATGFTATQIDITQAKAREHALEARVSTLRCASELARVGGWEVDFATRTVLWSPEILPLLQRPSSVEDLDEAMSIYDDEYREVVRAQIQHTVATGERLDFVSRVLRPNNTPLWVRVMGDADFVDGRCFALRGFLQNITVEYQGIIDLTEAERFGRGVIDGVGALLVVIDESGSIVAANKMFSDAGPMALRTPNDPIGSDFFGILARLPAPYGGILRKGLRAVLAGEIVDYSRPFRSPAGVWHRLTARRFAGDGPTRCVVITQSIAEIKRSEERLRRTNAKLKRARDDADAANAAKSDFLATMSHEIRTPLNGVLGMAQAMARDDLPDVQRQRLTVIRQAGETLLSLLNDLLDLSRIETGRLELEDGVVDIAHIAQGAQATFTTLASEKDVHFGLNVSPEAAGLWRGDPTRVRQIVYNLVSNAVKFTGRGSVLVDVSHTEGRLVFEVRDTGPGIPADRMASLFHKFVQVDASTTRRYGGSGLGLAICRELAALMGGEVTAESRLGEGSVFTARLPLARMEGAAAATEAPTYHLPDAALRVLAAEDNPMNQLVLKTLLAQVGVTLQVVSDGAAAVAAWETGDWDVILMDVQMPVMDGPTATRTIRDRERAAGSRRTPIIALTANAMAHHQAEYMAAGMDAFVAKPLEIERLFIAIETVLAGASAASQVA